MIKKVWEFLGSVRLAIILIIIFSVVSLFGVLIPQGLPFESYLKKWGDFTGKLILFFGFDRIFSTHWFYFLLELLSINVLVCSSTRLWKNIERAGRVKFWTSVDKVSTFKFQDSFDVPKGKSISEKSVLTFFKRKLYKVFTQKSEKGIQICAKKGRLKAYGSFLFHIGIVLLFIGGLYGRLKGHSYHKQLKKGEKAEVANRDFFVRCDWFKLEKNEKGMIKDYKSKLVLLNSDNSVIKEKIIEVNSPLSHKGIRFYQSSYATDPDRIENVVLRISGPGFAPQGLKKSFEFAQEVSIPESELKINIQHYVPDFIIDTKTRQVMSRSREPHNPAFKIVMYNDSDTLFNQWLFAKFPNQHPVKSNYSISLMEFTPEYTTGIQIRNNPGVPLIWVSIIIMTIGIIVTFYFSKETIWVFIESEDSKNSSIVIGGKLGEGFDFAQTRFENICQTIKNQITSNT